MFFNRKSAAAARIATPPEAKRAPATAGAGPGVGPTASSDDVTPVLDALGAILQAYGRHTIDTDSGPAEASRAEIASWTRHVTMGAAHPAKAGAANMGIAARDWRGLVYFMSEHRRGERQYVVKALSDLRETIWAFVGCAHQITRAEEASGRTAAAQLERVKAAVESNETDAIRREALAAVEVVGALLERRREEQRREFAALGERLRALGDQLEEARRESSLDPLTQLANRKGLEELLTRSVALHTVSGQPSSLLMIDVDNFKSTNDTFGHAVGDAALRAIADCLSRVFRRRCDLVCRYGGDEFAVLLHETRAAKAVELGERLREAVREVRLPDRAASLTLEVSVGVAELRGDDTAERWVQRADEALYGAKRRGGGQVASR